MTVKPVYFERILFREMFIALGLIAGWLAVLVVWDGGAIFPPTPVFVFLILLLVLVLVNFSRLTIRMSPENITVGYGRVIQQIPWKNIESCYLDETSTIFYGGFGIRFARIRGRWRLVYNIMSTPRVVLSLKTGKFQEFVFSTKNPDEVMNLINDRVAGAKS